MSVHSLSSRAGAAAAATALLLCTSLATADAAGSAQARSVPATVTSASWGAVAATAATAPYALAPLVINFPNAGTGGQGNPKNQSELFAVVNVGNLSLTAAEYTVTASNSAPFSVEACSGAWVQRDHTCSGQLTVLTTVSTPTISSIVPAAPGAAISLRARLTGQAPNHTTVTINIKVTRAQVRPGTISGS